MTFSLLNSIDGATIIMLEQGFFIFLILFIYVMALKFFKDLTKKIFHGNYK